MLILNRPLLAIHADEETFLLTFAEAGVPRHCIGKTPFVFCRIYIVGFLSCQLQLFIRWSPPESSSNIFPNLEMKGKACRLSTDVVAGNQ